MTHARHVTDMEFLNLVRGVLGFPPIAGGGWACRNARAKYKISFKTRKPGGPHANPV